MKLHKYIPLLVLPVSPMLAQAPDTATKEQVFELSPFVVESAEDSGYYASQTLAGTRLKTNIEDVASSIQVLTEDFLDDIGATSNSDLFLYTTSTEASGINGNFSDSSTSGGNTNTDDAFSRENPQESQRVRGLSRADLTRDYQLTIIPTDRFNTERVEINRGANSILYGLGSPAGIVNNSLAKARFSDSNMVRFRVDDQGSFRAEFDFNKVVIENKLALRVMLLSDETKYYQKPAFQDDRRIYATATYRPWKGGTLRGFIENGERDANRPSIIPPTNTIDNWFANQPVMVEKMRATLAAAAVNLTVPDDYPLVYNHLDQEWRSGNNYLKDANIPDDIKLGILRNHVIYRDNNAANPRMVDHPNMSRNLAAIFLPGQTYPGGAPGGVSAIQANIGQINNPPLFLNPDGKGTRSTGYVYMAPVQPWRVDPVLVPESMSNLEVFDFTKSLLAGDSAFQNDNWNHYNLTFEQLVLNNNAGIELAFDHQDYERETFTPFQGYTGIFVDLMEVYFGEPNPNFGRPYVASRTSKRDFMDDRTTLRATAFYKLDPAELFPESESARWLGKHTFTALYNDYEQESSNALLTEFFEDEVAGVTFSGSDELGNNRRRFNYLVYIGDSVLGLDSADQVRLNRLDGQQLWNPGQSVTYRTLSADGTELITETATSNAYIENYTRNTQEVKSTALIWNGSFLDNHLIGLFGWREDEATSIVRQAPTGSNLLAEVDRINEPESVISILDDTIQTTTWSVVAHLPDPIMPRRTGLSFFYGESENFSLAATPTDFYGDQLPSPSGDTKEYGFTLRLFEDKLIARVNWFKSVLANKPSDNLYSKFINQGILKPYAAFLEAEAHGFEPPTTDPDTGAVIDAGTPNYQLVLDTLAQMRALIPQELIDRANLDYVSPDGITNRNDLDNLGDTEDIEAKGVELELTYNPLKNWRMSLNVSKQETVVTNFSPRMGLLVDQFYDILGTGDASRLRYFVNAESDPPQFSSDPFPADGSNITTNAQWLEVNVFAPYRNLKSQEGRVSAEQREWRVNFVTNYSFPWKSRLRGWGLGSAVRWQDGAVIGYPTKVVDGLLISDIDNPHVAPSELTVDAWVRYKTKILDGAVDMTIELRVFNLNTSADELIPVRSKNTEDYQVAVWRVGPPRTWRLTCDFKF